MFCGATVMVFGAMVIIAKDACLATSLTKAEPVADPLSLRDLNAVGEELFALRISSAAAASFMVPRDASKWRHAKTRGAGEALPPQTVPKLLQGQGTPRNGKSPQNCQCMLLWGPSFAAWGSGKQSRALRHVFKQMRICLCMEHVHHMRSPSQAIWA